MADKKTKKDDSALVEAAEAIGSAVGKVAAAIGVKSEKNTPPTNIKIPKLAKSGKTRVPRKLKKLTHKKAAAAK